MSHRVVSPNHDLDGTEDKFHTRVELDIEGNQRDVRDANKKAHDAQGNEVVQAGYGRAADTIIYIDVQTLPRPTRGTGWKKYWKRD